MKLLLACFLFCVIGVQVYCSSDYNPSKRPVQNKVAFVRDFPSFLHKCDATFVRFDILVTTAQCVYCANKCDFYVRLYSDQLTGADGISYKVQEVIPHPMYGFTRYDSYDIALIILGYPVEGVIVYDLPIPSAMPLDFPAQMYNWKFTENNDGLNFRLVSYDVRKISNMMCTTILDEYVHENEVCCLSQNQTFSMGSYDQGSPLTAKIANNNYILGIYNGHHIYDRRVAKFISIVPFVEWIQSHFSLRNPQSAQASSPYRPAQNNQHASSHLLGSVVR